MSQIGVLLQDAESLISLTGNTGGAVLPSAGNIDIVGIGPVSVTGNPGTSTLTISVSATGMTWQTISASQTLAIQNGYFCTGGGALALLLPAVSSVGDEIIISLDGSTSFQITQGAGQSIKIANQASTAGVTGSVTTTQQGDTITLVCSVANLNWRVINSVGNFIIV